MNKIASILIRLLPKPQHYVAVIMSPGLGSEFDFWCDRLYQKLEFAEANERQKLEEYADAALQHALTDHLAQTTFHDNVYQLRGRVRVPRK